MADADEVIEKMSGDPNQDAQQEVIEELEEGGTDFEGNRMDRLDPDSPVTDPKTLGATEEGEESSSSEEASSDSESDTGSSSTDKDQLSSDELLSKVRSGEVSDSDLEVLEEAVKAHRNKSEWQKRLTQRSQEISQLEDEYQEAIQFLEQAKQLPQDHQRYLQEQIQKTFNGEISPEDTGVSSLKDEIELPERIQEDDEASEFYESLLDRVDSALQSKDQKIRRLENQLNQVSQQAQRRAPDEVDPQTVEEASAAAEELAELKDQYSDVLTGPDGEDRTDEIISHASEQAQQGNNISLKQAMFQLYPEDAEASLKKSGQDAALDKLGQNGTVIEDTGEDEEDVSDQSSGGGLEELIKESQQKGGPKAGHNEMKETIKSMMNS